ncbi:MAG TPA: hypothetical protein VFP66_16335 [Candidatus Limnocylindrales bacterium]|nr:hypothetical protein [Candidatus Limnocylindrales bacterium]
MPRKHSESTRLEALALAEVGGAEFAATTLGIDPRTVASWQLAAGAIAPPTADELEPVYRLAIMKLTEAIASGRIHGPQLGVVTGILRDKRDKAARWRERLGRQKARNDLKAEPQTSVQEAIDELEAIMAEVYPETDLQEIISILLDHGRLNEADEPENAAVTEQDGEAVIDSWLATLASLVKEHGSLKAAHEWQRAEEHRRLEEQLERNRINSERAIASSRQAMLDNETRSLLAAAEAFLREGDDA